MKRIVFLDYVRVFACFLVIVVHASENFYGAAGSTDMAGPQSFLANESDRLWVSIYDGFSRMAVPLFIIVSAFLLTPMKEELTSWQFYRQRCIRILPPFLLFMVLYSTLPLLWGQIDAETSVKDLSRILLNFPTQAGHLWFLYPLISLYFLFPSYLPGYKKLQPKKNVSSSACSCYRPACRISTAGGEKFGDNVSGTNSTCCSISPASSVTWSWHIICTPTSPGAAPNASEQESL